MTLTDKQRIELSLLETYTKLADADPTFIETIKNTGLASAQFIVRHFEQFQSEFRWEDDEIGNVEISQILSAPPQRIYREQHCRNNMSEEALARENHSLRSLREVLKRYR